MSAHVCNSFYKLFFIRSQSGFNNANPMAFVYESKWSSVAGHDV